MNATKVINVYNKEYQGRVSSGNVTLSVSEVESASEGNFETSGSDSID